jgi:hypothetical protein
VILTHGHVEGEVAAVHALRDLAHLAGLDPKTARDLFDVAHIRFTMILLLLASSASQREEQLPLGLGCSKLD